jgi:hypothetical protein
MTGRGIGSGGARLRLIERSGLLVAEPEEPLPPLTVEQVRETLERIRRDRLRRHRRGPVAPAG